MRVIDVLTLAILPFATALPVTPEAKPEPRGSSFAEVDRLLFHVSLQEFTSHRKAHYPADLDWTSDACSYVLDRPLGFDFKEACRRHDFGYANYRMQHRFTVSNRIRINHNFKHDMRDQCSLEKHEHICKLVATIYYEAVKYFGGRDAKHEK